MPFNDVNAECKTTRKASFVSAQWMNPCDGMCRLLASEFVVLSFIYFIYYLIFIFTYLKFIFTMTQDESGLEGLVSRGITSFLTIIGWDGKLRLCPTIVSHPPPPPPTHPHTRTHTHTYHIHTFSGTIVSIHILRLSSFAPDPSPLAPPPPPQKKKKKTLLYSLPFPLMRRSCVLYGYVTLWLCH